MRKTLYPLFLLLLALIFTTTSLAQTAIPEGDVFGKWEYAGSPYTVQGDITIPDDSTLIVEPDVLVIFEGYYTLNVQGRLLAIGSKSEMITFTINDTTGFFNSDTTLGGWNGIQFIDTPLDNDTSKIIFCSFQFAKAVGSSPPDNSGGAIFISNFNKVLISDCQISNNSAGGLNSPAGGALCLRSANIILENNEISYNHALDGGGIQIWESDPVFINNKIIFNTADVGGGGIWIGGISNSKFDGDTISNNTAGINGGGIICWQTTNTTLHLVTITYNIANWGGGIGVINGELLIDSCILSDNGSLELSGGLGSDFSTVNIINTNFERDTAGVYGGAMGIYNSELFINNSNLKDNIAAIFGGGIHSDFSKIIIYNTRFDRDSAGNSGGGIFAWKGDLKIDNSEFSNNTAKYSGGGIYTDSSTMNIDSSSFIKNAAIDNGGAIFLNLSTTSINNTSFDQNASTWGGGILSGYSDLNLNDCLYSENSSEHGGAISFGYGGAEFNNVSFINNEGIWGGGISATDCNIKIDSCIFYQNTASQQAGAVEYIADTSGSFPFSQIEISNSKFEENSSLSRFGAMTIEQNNSNIPLVNVLIDKCEFINNDALRIGALRIGNVSNFTVSNSKFIGNKVAQNTAASTFTSSSTGRVYNCLFADNFAGTGTSGGTGVSNGAEVDFINCTFVNNSSGGGGGIHVRRGAIATLTNSILWGNHPDQISLFAVDDTSACTLYVNYSDIHFGIDSIKINDIISVVNWGIGNINSEPLFIDTLNGDYHLNDSSVCIAAGIDSIKIAGIWHYAPLVDIEGNLRPSPKGSLPDMGAFESPLPKAVGINNEVINVPTEYALEQNFPNPFNPTTTIKYSVPDVETGHAPSLQSVTLKVYDILGREITILVNKEQKPGYYEVRWDASNQSSGVYFYRIQAGDFVQTKKMVLLR